MFKVNFDDKKIEVWIKKNQKELPAMVKSVINQTSAYGLSALRLDLPIKSGNLRNSYIVKKQTPLTHIILSPSRYADSMETGYKSHIIVPRAGRKFLMFSNNKSTANLDGSVKKAASTKLWKSIGVSKNGKLYSKINGEDNILDIFKSTGVTLARKVTIPAYAGAHTIKNKTLPKIDSYFLSKIMEGIKKTNG